MTTVIIRNTPFDHSNDEVHSSVAEVGSWLFEYFQQWPSTAKIYQGEVSEENVIPLETEQDVYKLNSLTGTIYVVVYPLGMALTGIAFLAATAAIIFSAPKEKSKSSTNADQRKVPEGSPNNSLSARSNKERINNRIPDIYGRVRSIPDLIMPTYRIYEGNKEVEHGLMAVGRGAYFIDDVREDATLLKDVPGSIAEFYAPFTSPNLGKPQLTINGTINRPFIKTKRSNSVSGAKLEAPNSEEAVFNVSVQTGEVVNGSGVPVQVNLANQTFLFDQGKFAVGDVLIVNCVAGLLGLTGSYDLSGIYTVSGFADDLIIFDKPPSAEAGWNQMAAVSAANGNAPVGFYVMHSGGYYAVNGVVGSWNTPPGTPKTKVGPFILDDAQQVIVNLSARDGIWSDDGVEQFARTVSIELTMQPINADDQNIGSPVVQTINLTGSATNRNFIGKTHVAYFASPQRLKVWMERKTDNGEDELLTYGEDVYWDDLYAAKPITESHFGNVTIVRTATYVSTVAANLNNRKLNCRAARLIPRRNANGTWSQPTITSRFADIAVAVSLDPLIGNRTIEELDIDNFYAKQAEIEAYFGTPIAAEFNHTFDDENLSFEDTISIIAECVHCSAYRMGRLIKFSFEKETDHSLILFNHRNKLPNSEVRSVLFGNVNNKDGVALEYVNPEDGSLIKFHIPEDQSAINPEEIRQYGVQYKLQAYFHAHRIWNRLRYQNTAVEFDATQEAALLGLNDRIQVADNTRNRTFDGEVVSRFGNVLTISQPFTFEAGKSYVIFLQNTDATIQSIPIVAGPVSTQIILQQDTNLPLALDLDVYARTTYEIVEI